MRSSIRNSSLPLILTVALALLALFAAMLVKKSEPILADDAKFYLDCPTTEVLEGKSFDVFLVRVTNHQHDAVFGFQWYIDSGTANKNEVENPYSEGIWSTEAEAGANRAKLTFSTTQDDLAEGDETFTVRFGWGGKAVDRNDPERDHKCQITIKDDDPNITAVEVTSTPEEGDTYGRQETIEITATFNVAVDVDGNPGLGMWVGGNWRAAQYVSGSGTENLVFGYAIKPEDSDDDGIRMDGGYQDNNGRWHNFLNHTAVTATGTDIVAHRTYKGIDDQGDRKVDGSIDNVDPTVSSVRFPMPLVDGGLHKKDDVVGVEVIFSEDVVVTGSPQIELDVGGQARLATYKVLPGLSNADRLPFFYTIQDGDHDLDGISIDASKLTLNGGTIEDSAGNTAVLTHSAIEDNPNQLVKTDFTQPEVSTIAFTSDPGDDNSYAAGDEVEVTATFTENVEIVGTGTMQVELTLDNVPAFAMHDNTDGATMKFTYQVSGQDVAENGISIPASSISVAQPDTNETRQAGVVVSNTRSLPAKIVDSAGNQAILYHEPIPANAEHKVDGIAPTISSVAITSSAGDDNTYANGDKIEVTVTFSENVTVTGSPQLSIDVGGTAKSASYSSTDEATVVFSYTVVLGDSDDDGISIGANKLSLNGGKIKDAAGNKATLTHSAVAADFTHKVSAPGGL